MGAGSHFGELGIYVLREVFVWVGEFVVFLSVSFVDVDESGVTGRSAEVHEAEHGVSWVVVSEVFEEADDRAVLGSVAQADE